MPPKSEALREVMRHWTAGVGILSTRADGVAHGMTVNSFTSVALEPPLVLVCVDRKVRTHALIEQSRIFAVSILRAEHAWLSNRFAGRETEVLDRYEGIETFTAVTGAPILKAHFGYIDCTLFAAHPTGPHTIFVGEVQAAATPDEGSPLLYYNRAYRQLAE